VPTWGRPPKEPCGFRHLPLADRAGWLRNPAYSARVAVRELVYAVYERRLRRQLVGRPVPRHVGVMCDGNRRWARAAGAGDVSFGHQAGADKIEDVLRWSADAGVEVVTLWLLSTENLTRPDEELRPLLGIIEELVGDLAADRAGWRIKLVGALDLLPPETAHVLKAAAERTADGRGLSVNIAVGYGGRQEIADAVRSLLHEHAAAGTSIEELAEVLDVDHIAEHLYTRGEQRMSGFLLWQSAHSEFYFCEAYWPDFRRIDFLRALRAYADRHRRFGA
jgi:short-chain Z-isoprenyl diphosphate synthase